MQFPTFKTVFFGHAAFSVLYVRAVLFFAGPSPHASSWLGVFILLLSDLISFLSYSTLLAFLVINALLARRTKPAFAAQYEAAYESMRARGFLCFAAAAWAITLVPNFFLVVICVVMSEENIGGFVALTMLVGIWPPIYVITYSLVLLPMLLSNIATFVYFVCVWLKSVVLVVRRVVWDTGVPTQRMAVLDEEAYDMDDDPGAKPEQGKAMPRLAISGAKD